MGINYGHLIRVIPFSFIFVFSNKHYNFENKYGWKNLHPVYGAGIRTHYLQNMSLLRLLLDQDFHPNFGHFCRNLVAIFEYFVIFCQNSNLFILADSFWSDPIKKKSRSYFFFRRNYLSLSLSLSHQPVSKGRNNVSVCVCEREKGLHNVRVLFLTLSGFS